GRQPALADEGKRRDRGGEVRTAPGAGERRRGRKQADGRRGDDGKPPCTTQREMIEIRSDSFRRSGASFGDAAVGEDGGYRQRRRLAARAGNAAQSARRPREPGAHRTGANGGQKRAQRASRAANGGLERGNPAAGFDAGDPGSGVDGGDAVERAEVEQDPGGRSVHGGIAAAAHAQGNLVRAHHRHRPPERGDARRSDAETSFSVLDEPGAGGGEVVAQRHRSSFPGLRMPCGSKAFFRARNCRTPSPSSRRRKSCRSAPTPEWCEIVPPSSVTAESAAVTAVSLRFCASSRSASASSGDPRAIAAAAAPPSPSKAISIAHPCGVAWANRARTKARS